MDNYRGAGPRGLDVTRSRDTLRKTEKEVNLFVRIRLLDLPCFRRILSPLETVKVPPHSSNKTKVLGGPPPPPPIPPLMTRPSVFLEVANVLSLRERRKISDEIFSIRRSSLNLRYSSCRIFSRV